MKVFQKGRLKRQREYVSAGEGQGMKVKTALDKVYSELSMLNKVRHPNCCHLYAVFDEKGDTGELYMIITYAERGTTMEWNPDRSRFESPETSSTLPHEVSASFLRDTLVALSYLHS